MMVLGGEGMHTHMQYLYSSAVVDSSPYKFTWLVWILAVILQLWELEEEHLQSDHRVHGLKIALENKEKEVQGFLLASSEANTAIKKLEEHVQR